MIEAEFPPPIKTGPERCGACGHEYDTAQYWRYHPYAVLTDGEPRHASLADCIKEIASDLALLSYKIDDLKGSAIEIKCPGHKWWWRR